MNWVQKLHQLPKWKVYSQSGEEAYLEHILLNVPSVNKTIVEFGAWDGKHLSNTLYFEEKHGYKRVLFDGDNRGNEAVIEKFITMANCVQIMEEQGVAKEFDLFCIDLDGNDYHILDEVLFKFKPTVVIAEFNPIFPPEVKATIKYNPDHTWQEDDFYGFSFGAGVSLAEHHGYLCIFQNDNLNMYFVEKNKLADSLNCEVDELFLHVPKVEYQVTNYHPKSQKTEWVQFD